MWQITDSSFISIDKLVFMWYLLETNVNLFPH